MNKHIQPDRDPALPEPSARDRAYEGIRAGILRGTFRPGTFIEEVAASAETGVSRSPVREALNRLAAEGFLELYPRRGALVRPLAPSEVGDLHEVRLMLEQRAVMRICDTRRAVPSDLIDLCDAYAVDSTTDHLEHVRLNWLFHRTLVAASGNDVLLQVFDNLEANLTRVAMLSLQLGVGDTDVIAREHAELIRALIAHDKAGALAVLERHLEPVRRLDGAAETGAPA
ncbi:MAG: GntR family transcriptional regulator [Jannaschia sp.]